ncbi:MAG: O-antigen ligase family protein [Holophagales bacterium]|nr:O-antigen ligase family protein [Holophagales bacterium]
MGPVSWHDPAMGQRQQGLDIAAGACLALAATTVVTSTAASPLGVARCAPAAGVMLAGLFLLAIAAFRLGPKGGSSLHTALGISALLCASLMPGTGWTGAALVPPLLAPIDVNGGAGALTLFLPLWTALAFDPGRGTVQRCLWTVLALGATTSIWIAGSRGAILAAFLGLATLLLMGARRPARLGIVAAVVVAGTLLAALAFPVRARALALDLVLEDRAQGWSLQSATSGRWGIWEASWMALGDLPLAGIGAGAFREVVPRFYPGSLGSPTPGVAHAHDLWLQTALDTGLPGALALLGLVSLATIRLVRHRQAVCGGVDDGASDAERRRTAGIAGGLAGFLAFGLGDAVPLWHAGALGFYSLLGLALCRSPTAPGGALRRAVTAPIHPSRTYLATASIGGAVGVGLIVGFLAWGADTPLDSTALDGDSHALPGGSERESRAALRALLHPRAEVRSRSDSYPAVPGPASDPGVLWLRGHLRRAAGDRHGQLEDWRALLQVSRRHLPMVESVLLAQGAPLADRARLARGAVERWPADGRAWLWLARSIDAPSTDAHSIDAHSIDAHRFRAGGPGARLSPADGDGARSPGKSAAHAYARAVTLLPGHGLAWLELARLHRDGGRVFLAAWAFARACENGDPGANACGAAGRLAEQAGRDRHAIALYRKSRWPPFRARADTLGGQPTDPGKVPD